MYCLVLQVLRLEPHIVVTNLTGAPLQLLQCRPTLAGGSNTAGGAHAGWGELALPFDGAGHGLHSAKAWIHCLLTRSLLFFIALLLCAVPRRSPSGMIVPEGGSSFSQSSRSLGGLPMQQGGCGVPYITCPPGRRRFPRSAMRAAVPALGILSPCNLAAVACRASNAHVHSSPTPAHAPASQAPPPPWSAPL